MVAFNQTSSNVRFSPHVKSVKYIQGKVIPYFPDRSESLSHMVLRCGVLFHPWGLVEMVTPLSQSSVKELGDNKPGSWCVCPELFSSRLPLFPWVTACWNLCLICPQTCHIKDSYKARAVVQASEINWAKDFTAKNRITYICNHSALAHTCACVCLSVCVCVCMRPQFFHHNYLSFFFLKRKRKEFL